MPAFQHALMFGCGELRQQFAATIYLAELANHHLQPTEALMADAPDPASVTKPSYRNSDTAALIYFDIAAAHGVMNGAIQIELGARTLTPLPDGGVAVEFVSVARLRCTPTAAQFLRRALDESLKMVEQLKQGPGPAIGTGRLN
jgi:hypothetical protein